MRTEASIEIRTAFSPPVTIDLDYRPWTADPDPWEVHLGPLWRPTKGDWLCENREARLSSDILHLGVGSSFTTHDLVMTLFGVPHLRGTNPFFRGQSGRGRAGAFTIHSSIPPNASVVWTVIKGPPPPQR